MSFLLLPCTNNYSIIDLLCPQSSHPLVLMKFLTFFLIFPYHFTASLYMLHTHNYIIIELFVSAEFPLFGAHKSPHFFPNFSLPFYCFLVHTTYSQLQIIELFVSAVEFPPFGAHEIPNFFPNFPLPFHCFLYMLHTHNYRSLSWLGLQSSHSSVLIKVLTFS